MQTIMINKDRETLYYFCKFIQNGQDLDEVFEVVEPYKQFILNRINIDGLSNSEVVELIVECYSKTFIPYQDKFIELI